MGGRTVLGRKHQQQCEFPWEDCSCMKEATKAELKDFLELLKQSTAVVLLTLGEGLSTLGKSLSDQEKDLRH